MIIQSERIWMLNNWMAAQIEINNERIKNIYPYNFHSADIDYKNKRIVPGFIDCHTHGAYGFDTNDADPEGLRNWAEQIVEEGVTGFCPTTITQSEDVLIPALENVADVMEQPYSGAQILGVHLEGPFLNPLYKGAQPEEYCVEASVDRFKKYEKASGNYIKIVTIASEHDPGYTLTKYCVSKGIAVSQGHSSASFEQAQMAIAHGAKSMTHVYNGMSKYQHREPGLVGSAFYFKDVYGEIIGDFLHSNKEAVNIFFNAKGANYGILISDSLKVKGLEAGTRTLFGGQWIELYRDGSAHLADTGNLAGSTLKINQGLRNLVEIAMVPWHSAINACTINPARMLRIDDQKGSIQVGKDADLVVMNDDYSIRSVFVNGIKQ